MLKWVTVETARVGNSEFALASHGDDFVVRVDGRVLMSNRVHESEISLAEEAIDRASDPRHVLVGGLGLGFTLRATLDLLPEDARVTVAELVPEIVRWNRTHLKHLHDDALADPRCDVVVGDAFDVLRDHARTFDVILLDVDNGPQALSQEANHRLYDDGGVRACWNALTPGGVLAVWSAGPMAKFTARLARGGFDAEELRVPARSGGGAKHVLFLGTRRARPDAPRRKR
jgi:spermidine synthase